MFRKSLYVSILTLCLAGVATASAVPVDITDSSFGPASVTVEVGDTVIWTNSGVLPHTTTSGTNGTPDGLWDSGTLTNGQSFSRVFLDEGSFSYFCRFHYLGGMTGVVNVRLAGVEEAPQAILPSGVRVFPNPLPGDGRVSFELRRAGYVSVRVFDVQGRVASELLHGPAGPGRVELSLSPSDRRGRRLHAGAYYLVVEAEARSSTVPFVVAR